MASKLCEINVKGADSLKELIYQLTSNGYAVQTAVVWKEYPQTGIDHWQIAIFDESNTEDESAPLGRWKGLGMGDYACSYCWEAFSGGNRYNYCPNCGEKMYAEGGEADG